MPAPAVDPQLANSAILYGEAGYTPSQIAGLVPLPRSTIQYIVDKHGKWGEIADKPVFAALRQEQQKILESGARALAAQAMTRTEEALPKASALQAATVFAIMVDKSRLLAGESTQIVDLHTSIDIAALDKLASALSLALMPQAIDITPQSK